LLKNVENTSEEKCDWVDMFSLTKVSENQEKPIDMFCLAKQGNYYFKDRLRLKN
jgi:hypothetical protein